MIVESSLVHHEEYDDMIKSIQFKSLRDLSHKGQLDQIG